MHEIICPHCAKAFKIDEAGYADILKQVRDSEFEKQLHERLELAAQDKESAIELAKNAAAQELQKITASKDCQSLNNRPASDARQINHFRRPKPRWICLKSRKPLRLRSADR